MGLGLAFLILAGFSQDPDPNRVQRLIQALGDDSKEERDKAVADLVRIGRPALDALQKATKSSDSEVRALAAQAVEKIEWGAGTDKLKKYVKEHFDDNANPEVSKLKALAKWFPDTRFYEVAQAPAAGGAVAIMGMQGPRSVFAVRKHEDGFYRLVVKGITSPDSVKALLGKQKIVLRDSDAALDFAIAFMDLAGVGQANAMAVWAGGGGSRLERTEDGWSLQASGTQLVFKVDKEGTLVDLVPSSNPYFQFGLSAGADKGSAEKEKLEVEKLKLEIELLKRQIQK